MAEKELSISDIDDMILLSPAPERVGESTASSSNNMTAGLLRPDLDRTDQPVGADSTTSCTKRRNACSQPGSSATVASLVHPVIQPVTGVDGGRLLLFLFLYSCTR